MKSVLKDFFVLRLVCGIIEFFCLGSCLRCFNGCLVFNSVLVLFDEFI